MIYEELISTSNNDIEAQGGKLNKSNGAMPEPSKTFLFTEKHAVANEDGDVRTHIFSALIPYEQDIEEEEYICHEMVASLTDEQKEKAAYTSYAYFATSFGGRETPKGLRDKMATRMARRYLQDTKGDKSMALNRMLATLEFRENMGINRMRENFSGRKTPDLQIDSQNDVDEETDMQSILINDFYTKTFNVCGYDLANHAILAISPKEYTTTDDSFVKIICYFMERAIACTERKSLGKEEKIVAVVDFSKSGSGCRPSTNALKNLLFVLQSHYPECLHMLIVLEPPSIIAWIKTLLWPFVDPVTKEKFRFYSGEEEMKRELMSVIKDTKLISFLLDEREETNTESESEISSIPFDHATSETRHPSSRQGIRKIYSDFEQKAECSNS